ncbi:MAG: hypothetical protein AAGC58_12800 [Asticcacaulis sp.]
MELIFTRHAQRRAQQQAVLPHLVETVLLHADIEMPLANDQLALRLSSDALHGLAHDYSLSLAEQVKDVVLILNGKALVTVLRAWGQPGRSYRRRDTTCSSA